MNKFDTVADLLNELDNIEIVVIKYGNLGQMYIGEHEIEGMSHKMLEKTYKFYEVTKLRSRSGYCATIFV